MGNLVVIRMRPKALRTLAHIPVQVYPSIVSIQVADEICRAPRRERKSHGPNHSRFRVAVKERLPVLSPEVRILSCTPDNQHKHGRNLSKCDKDSSWRRMEQRRQAYVYYKE